jgi:NADH:ubiquinone oxidoreductase subunit 5 (subunit L)/multisubunit Na+/H+ antiporter MnhA subunit
VLSRIGGLQKKMPVTAVTFWIAAFSISGIPLFNGYVSKGMILLAAEQTSIWLWVLLEIASFGTFVSFLKLGYFAFLRPGDTKASDPPLLMQAGMLGAAALCIVIGIYPQILYALLPYPVVYDAYAPLHVVSALLVLGFAAVFFFAVGRKFLEPHDTSLTDFDMVYEAAGRGITAFAGVLQLLFGRIYNYAIDASRMLFTVGKYLMGMENRDANWNAAVFAGVLVAFMVIITMGVGW